MVVTGVGHGLILLDSYALKIVPRFRAIKKVH